MVAVVGCSSSRHGAGAQDSGGGVGDGDGWNGIPCGAAEGGPCEGVPNGPESTLFVRHRVVAAWLMGSQESCAPGDEIPVQAADLSRLEDALRGALLRAENRGRPRDDVRRTWMWR